MNKYEITMTLWEIERDEDGDEIDRTKLHEVVPSPNVHECPQDEPTAIKFLDSIADA